MRPAFLEGLTEALRLSVKPNLTGAQAVELVRYVEELELRMVDTLPRIQAIGAPPRQVFCPACNQIRGCQHLADRLLRLEAAVARAPEPAR